ncbi:nitroreductase family protein [Aneurinibacillus migulanus]|uniref:nitroreductase family protein n=1 Tax=Aneurinibacillus migulanus TaxID=47500 RepID=UPI002E24720D|nr:nitroreductase family protein [Aneurinibacillus migulanus]
MVSSLESIITSRRTVRKTKSSPIPLEIIEDILEKAAYAPFHSEVEPWSVKIASTEEEKQYFFDCILRSYDRTGVFASYSEEQVEKVKAAYKEYLSSTPVTMIVATDVFQDEKKDFESIGATCSFIQNIQLLSWEKNIGTVWRTNPYIFDPVFAKDIGIPPSKKVIGSVHLGYPEQVPKAKERRPVHEWMTRIAP